MEHDYSKLRGRIVEKYGTNAKFAKEIGLSQRGLWLKITGQTDFKQREIEKAIEKLELTDKDIGEYFFKKKVQSL